MFRPRRWIFRETFVILDLRFLKAGQTTRQEVTKNLAPIDAHIREPQFFWGTIGKLHSRICTTPLPIPCLCRSGLEPRNILIRFDQNDIRQGWKVLKDKDLLREPDQMEPTTPNLDLVAQLNLELPYEGQGQRPTAELVLSAASIKYKASDSALRMDRGNLAEIVSAPQGVYKDAAFHHEPDSSHIWITLHFAKRTRLGKSLTCAMGASRILDAAPLPERGEEIACKYRGQAGK